MRRWFKEYWWPALCVLAIIASVSPWVWQSCQADKSIAPPTPAPVTVREGIRRGVLYRCNCMCYVPDERR